MAWNSLGKITGAWHDHLAFRLGKFPERKLRVVSMCFSIEESTCYAITIWNLQMEYFCSKYSLMAQNIAFLYEILILIYFLIFLQWLSNYFELFRVRTIILSYRYSICMQIPYFSANSNSKWRFCKILQLHEKTFKM